MVRVIVRGILTESRSSRGGGTGRRIGLKIRRSHKDRAGSIPAPGISYNRDVTPSRLRIRTAQTLIGQARERTQLSMHSVLETANRILALQLQRPDLVLDRWILYQQMVTPTRSPFFPRGTTES